LLRLGPRRQQSYTEGPTSSSARRRYA
jgi:hypothetical protein